MNDVKINDIRIHHLKIINLEVSVNILFNDHKKKTFYISENSFVLITEIYIPRIPRTGANVLKQIQFKRSIMETVEVGDPTGIPPKNTKRVERAQVKHKTNEENTEVYKKMGTCQY